MDFEEISASSLSFELAGWDGKNCLLAFYVVIGC